jgi:hypothetical protein
MVVGKGPKTSSSAGRRLFSSTDRKTLEGLSGQTECGFSAGISRFRKRVVPSA